MHLEDVWCRCHYRDGADLEQAYNEDIRNCAACNQEMANGDATWMEKLPEAK